MTGRDEQRQVQPDPGQLRAEGAAEERAAILAIIERSMRQLVHGHGATGLQALDQILQEIQDRESLGGSGGS
jgi:hypothetical protein